MKTIANDTLWKTVGIILILLLVIAVAVYQQKYRNLQASVDRFVYTAANAQDERIVQEAFVQFAVETKSAALYRQSQAGFFSFFAKIGAAIAGVFSGGGGPPSGDPGLYPFYLGSTPAESEARALLNK